MKIKETITNIAREIKDAFSGPPALSEDAGEKEISVPKRKMNLENFNPGLWEESFKKLEASGQIETVIDDDNVKASFALDAAACAEFLMSEYWVDPEDKLWMLYNEETFRYEAEDGPVMFIMNKVTGMLYVYQYVVESMFVDEEILVDAFGKELTVTSEFSEEYAKKFRELSKQYKGIGVKQTKV